MALITMLSALVLFITAYFTYGKWMDKKLDINKDSETPATFLRDNFDFIPTSRPVIFGHHFSASSSILPIFGTIYVALYFGWLPAAIWCVVSSVFICGVEEFSSLTFSARNNGRSLSFGIEKYAGKPSKFIFIIFAMLSLSLVSAFLIDTLAKIFSSTPMAATIALLFTVCAILFSILTKKLGLGEGLTTIICLILMAYFITLGVRFPICLDYSIWVYVLLGYALVVNVLPIWFVVSPQNYLNSYFLYAFIGTAFFGIVAFKPVFNMPMVSNFLYEYVPIVPTLVVLVTTTAISSFNSIVSSCVTSKQISSERDIKVTSYTRVLIEGIVSLIAIVTVAILPSDTLNMLSLKGPFEIFSYGIGTFLEIFGIPFVGGQYFSYIAISIFALNSLESITRAIGSLFREMIICDEQALQERETKIYEKPYFGVIVSIIITFLAFYYAYDYTFNLIGYCGLLLSSIILMAISIWLKENNKNNLITLIPMYLTTTVIFAAIGYGIFEYIFDVELNIIALAVLVVLLAILVYTMIYLFKYLYKKEGV